MTLLGKLPSKAITPNLNTSLDIKTKATSSESAVTPQLIKLAQAGDREAMAQIYESYSPAIYRLLYRMVWQRETAQELMQDSFIDVLTNLQSYRGESGLYAWMRRIAVNRCLMHFRKHKASYIELDLKSEPVARETSEVDFDLQKMIKKLTPKRRMVVWLHEIEGMTHKEIAEIMGKSVSFSKTELSRAFEQLRSNIQGQMHQIPDSSNDKKPDNKQLNEQTEVALCTPLLNNS